MPIYFGDDREEADFNVNNFVGKKIKYDDGEERLKKLG